VRWVKEAGENRGLRLPLSIVVDVPLFLGRSLVIV